MSLFVPVFDALNKAGVRYVVVGGVAAVLHGHARLTADLDLVVDLDPPAARRAIEALTALGFRPRPPVPAIDFADPAIRRAWIEEKGLKVFSMFDPANPMSVVDLFAESPVPFDGLWERGEQVAIGTAIVRIASITDLVAMKRQAGREKDLSDVEALLEIEHLRRGSSR